MLSSDFQLLNSGYHWTDDWRLLLKDMKKANWKPPCYGVMLSCIPGYRYHTTDPIGFIFYISSMCVTRVLRSTNLNFLTWLISGFAVENCQRTHAQGSSYLWELPSRNLCTKILFIVLASERSTVTKAQVLQQLKKLWKTTTKWI